jgi:hypothetical protein
MGKDEDLSWIGIVILTIAVAPLVGCGSPDQRTEGASRVVHSWEATVRETSKALDRRAVPRLYARQVLQAAVQTRDQHAKQPEWNTLPPEVRSGLAEAIGQLSASLGESSGDQSRE